MTKKKIQKQKLREKKIKKARNIKRNNTVSNHCEFCANGLPHQHDENFIETL